jgi:hypothetical protein
MCVVLAACPSIASPAALVACIVLVSLTFDAQKVEGLLVWVQDNKGQGSVLFLVGGWVGGWVQLSAGALVLQAGRSPLFCLVCQCLLSLVPPRPLLVYTVGVALLFPANPACCTAVLPAPPCLQLVYTVGVVLMFPAMVMAMAAGAVFGMVYGTLLVWLGSSLGQTVAFVIGRCVWGGTRLWVQPAAGFS